MQFAVRHYFWEGSNKAKLEALIDLSIGVLESKGTITDVEEKL